MVHIKLFLMRHSKSCSNLVRTYAANADDNTDPVVVASQAIHDPGLTDVGVRKARAYGPRLLTRLRKEGFDCDHALIGASALSRAQETARLVFGRRRPVTFRYFAEKGQILENTPTESAYAAPDWDGFIQHLSTLVKEGDSVAVVGHGSFLQSLWRRLTGSVRASRLNNMDGILLDAEIGPRGLKVNSFIEIPYRGPSMMGCGDRCSVRKVQKGGFSAPIMGSFAANGMRLLPVALYMGYKMYSNKRGTKKKGRGSRTRTRTRTRTRVRPRT